MSSDSSSSEVTYTSISSHGDPLAWAVDFFGLQEPDSPEAALASPEYVPGPEDPEQALPSPDYVPGLEYPEYLAPANDEIVVEDQPYADYASPAALSPWYIADSDPEEDLEKDYEDGPVDYPVDRGDDDDDDDDSSDDEEEEEEASDEEEEHLASADSVVAPVVDTFPSAEETEPFEKDESAATPPPPRAYRTTTRISIRAQVPIPFPSKAEVDRLLAIPTPPSSPLSPWLSPLPQIPSPPLPLPSPPLPPLPASLFIPPPVNRREDTPKAELPPRKRLCLTDPTSRFEVGESSTATARPTRDPAEAVEEVAPTTLEGVNDRVTELAGVREEDTQDIYAVIEDVQDIQTRLSQRVDILIEDKEFHQETMLLMEQEALVSREAWAQSEALTAILVAQISFLQGQLSVALGQIQALQARDQTHADDPEGADSYA
ncbi:hypothetical protein Tco_1007090 [Tanacetum coccineum]